jgi:hypothetical protein
MFESCWAGIEIEDVLMIEDGAIVFVSSGTDFIVPSWDKREAQVQS